MNTASGSASHSVVLDTSPDQTWELIRDFGHVSAWHPIARASRIVAGSEGQAGAERELTLADGGTVRERLLARDDGTRTLTYRMVTFPIPVTDQENEIMVAAGDGPGQSRVTFTARFTAAPGHTAKEIEAINLGAFEMAARGLEQRLKGEEPRP